MNDALSLESRVKLTKLYESKLEISHSDTCVYRKKAHKYLEHVAADRLPVVFLSSLASPEANLLEHLEPLAIFAQNVKSLLGVTKKLVLTIEFPSSHSNLQPDGVWGPLLEKILVPDANEDSLRVAMQLALLGWYPVTETTCECKLCLARLNLVDSQKWGTFRKRRRVVIDPLDKHKFYCPYVGGLPRGPDMPFWKMLALRLIGELPENDDGERTQERMTAWQRVHRLLSRAVARNK